MEHLVVLLAALGTALAGYAAGGYEAYPQPQHGYYIPGHFAPAHYAFDYSVQDPHTGDYKAQRETREGDVVRGFYTLLEADGTTREVHYTADPVHGFVANVRRIGQTVHPPPPAYNSIYHVPVGHY
ncbi:Hypothetical protein NTJ_13545 [Nesidiocoris tenuis]|uniref:Cuticle protein 7 n=1 Tax=Nesidiocoris tenuis TaxID=355587 RepID=A0ABN7B8X0_9HEMI|nr:Hypothetical protein NTJ_13545 [Nesidiocoris tenuis]